MPPTCPECLTGKHGNCDGIGGITEDNDFVACGCPLGGHSPTAIAISEELRSKSNVSPIPLNVPEANPGIRADAFPELMDDHGGFATQPMRLAPDVEVIRELMDVEVQNVEGIWVPLVPKPMKTSRLGITTCLCGTRRLGLRRYNEHYAYAHILGMEN